MDTSDYTSVLQIGYCSDYGLLFLCLNEADVIFKVAAVCWSQRSDKLVFYFSQQRMTEAKLSLGDAPMSD